MANDFVHLHVHSEYSMLDGLGRIKELVKEAKRLGQQALALTDHGVMHGAIEFFRACKENEIKPIVGIEAYQTVWGRPMGGRDGQLDRENYHLLLLAKNMTGYRNLLKIASHSQLNGYYYRPRVDHDFLANHAEGIVCTTGCLGAEVPQLLMQGKEQEAYERFGWYVDVFGKENFYIELQEHSIPELIPVNKALAPWAEKFGVGLLATNDVHYVKEADADPHEMLLCVQTGESIKSEKRMRLSDQSYFLKSRAQMEETFRPFIDLPASAYDNSLRIADMCEVDLEDKNYHLPDMPIPEGFTYDTYLRHLTEEGLARLYGERAPNEEIQKRKEFELSVIAKMGFSIYFLIVGDLCGFAKSRNIWWNVRGSGAGSLVAYCIGITGLDPLKNSLIFERFLNPARVTMPDFDLDFPDDQREEMIRYTIEKYGKDQVAQIVTFGRMKARAAIKDVGRAQEVPLNQVNRIAQLIPAIPGKPVTIMDVMTEGHEFYNPELVQLYQSEPWVTSLLDYSMKLEGVTRHSGIHAAAVIVADKELVHYAPLMRPSKGSVTDTVAQFEFPILESIGLLKVDFLGLSTLSVMREAGRLIQERHAIEYTLASIPFEGEVTAQAFKLLSSGEVSGVFQVESAGMRRVLTEMKPHLFEHIIATISLYRPGPLEYIPNYIRRLHGEEPIEFKHPSLESILGETLGICVSGDALVTDARTGRRYRLDEVNQLDEFAIQGVDEDWQPAIGRVTHWIDSGIKPVYRVTLRNGAEIKVTADHRLLTEQGWQPLRDLQVGDYIATPHRLFGSEAVRASEIDRRQLRVLAYLLADGSLASMASVDFVSKDPAMLAEYQQCLTVFPDLRPVLTEQIRDVTRVGVAKAVASALPYHSPTSLLTWLRALGLKHPAGSRPGGLRSHEKFVPAFVFQLGEEEIAFFLASLWDCDGYMGNRLCHYKTISKQLATDLQTLLLRLGIRSTIYISEYTNPIPDTEVPDTEEGVHRQGYQVTVYDTAKLATLLQPSMVSPKKAVLCTSYSNTTIERLPFIAEVDAKIGLPYKTLMRDYGVDRQHFYAKAKTARPRISTQVIEPLLQAFPLTETQRRTGVAWEAIVAIEFVGDEHVYDLTVEGLHSFVANNIIVHNCIYQEQIIQILTKLAGYTAGEADLVRRAISKKKASDIEKHKKIFVEGCHKNNIPKDAAEAIYGDIEFFARYGFNKSHAADYAVITVQTAFLKAHYPVEYMAALLLIERDKTEKVVNFINECRRMGISVLAPDVNYSGLDFEIQELPSGVEAANPDPMLAFTFPVPPGSAIRFGMAAVKMVGEGPVKVILEARQEGGPFTSLEDLADRVDLRKVGKRPLECLMKVGALDRFGKRSQLLAVLDQLVANSASAHDARASGQLDLFGGVASASISTIRLPILDEVKSREKLTWEKELLGVYAASHPMQSLGIDMSKIVTCYCNELSEEHNGKNVTLAGMITSVRTINTKKGDQMAFVQLEDRQGQCEVVVFPRTYAEVKEKLVPDSLVIMKGKAQTREGQTSLLVDSIQNYVDQAVAGGEEPTQYQRPLLDAVPTINGLVINEATSGYDAGGMDSFGMGDFVTGDEESFGGDEENPFRYEPPAWLMDAPKPALDAAPEAAEPVAEPPALETDPTTPAPQPPPVQPAPEPNKRIRVTGSLTGAMNHPPKEPSTPPANGAAHEPSHGNGHQPEPVTKAVTEPSTPTVPKVESPAKSPAAVAPSAEPTKSNGHGGTPSRPKATTEAAPTGANGASGGHRAGRAPDRPAPRGNGRHLRITFRRSGDLDRDKYRLKEIYDHVRDPRGRDRFFIVVESNGQRYELAFPNDPCSISERLVSELTKHFRVEVVVGTEE
ncbi:MAG: DNA polymerase III subunit alpha [Caldilineaceae bacterium]|nr:DNA polymerase III subunit alpha [Caldilineaceae bacterium]